MQLDKNYWDQRYREADTPWNIGHASPPLVQFFDTLTDKNLKILIPGAGRGFEPIALHRRGFANVFVCDWAVSAFDELKREAPDFPEEHLIVEDFFNIPNTDFDLMVEQTFFCAIDRSLREKYARKCAELLRDGGRLAGLLFASEFQKPGPPFGGTKEAYLEIFSPFFDIKIMEITANSIAPRAGNELFFVMEKK